MTDNPVPCRDLRVWAAEYAFQAEAENAEHKRKSR